jgi:phosphoribosylanthranilate isomerase
MIPYCQISGITSVPEALMVARNGASPLLLVDLEYFREDAVDKETAIKIVEKMKRRYPDIPVVALSHSGDMDRVIEVVREIGAGVVQIHNDTEGGKEVPIEELARVRRELAELSIIKVLHLPEGELTDKEFSDVVAHGRRLATVVDALILDVGADELIKEVKVRTLGGTGKKLDWEVCKRIVEEIGNKVKIILAGGLTPDNVAEAIKHVRPHGVDVNGGTRLEGQKVGKDPLKVRRFADEALNALGVSSAQYQMTR